jgi:MFS family permease
VARVLTAEDSDVVTVLSVVGYVVASYLVGWAVILLGLLSDRYRGVVAPLDWEDRKVLRWCFALSPIAIQWVTLFLCVCGFTLAEALERNVSPTRCWRWLCGKADATFRRMGF